MSTNLLPNGDFTIVPPAPNVPTTTGMRWITGTATGSFNNQQYKWYFNNYNINGESSAQIVGGGEHHGGGSLTLSNNTVTAKSSANTVRFPAKPYTAYKLKAYVTTANVPTNGVYLKVNMSPVGGTANKSATTPKISGDNHCVEVSVEFTTIGSTGEMVVEFQNNVAGNICYAQLHDCTIEEVAMANIAAPLNIQTQYGVNSPFDISGTTWTASQLQGYCDKVLGFGGNIIRATFYYGYIHAVGTTGYNYGIYDTFVQICASKGIMVIPILSFPPANLGTEEFTDYFENVAAHFKDLGIGYYELWNEKNAVSPSNSTNDPAVYADLIKAAYPALKLGDPKCKVLMSGLTGNTTTNTTVNGSDPIYSPGRFLQALYDEGAGNCFDIVNLHIYGLVEAVIQDMIAVKNANGDTIKPLWVTEHGIPTNGTTNEQFTTQSGQATYLVAGIDLCEKYSIPVVLIYNGNDSIPRQPHQEGYYGITSGNLDNLVNKASYQAITDRIAGGV